jgi:quinol monooxygenase YgiN
MPLEVAFMPPQKPAQPFSQDGQEETQMIRATVRMMIPSRKQDEVMGILSSIAERARFEPGCISSRLYKGVEVKNRIMLEDLWRDEEALDRHLQSGDYRKLLLVVEMALEPPEIRFDAISQSSGFETIQKARRVLQNGERS